jgi:hypothetical protein
MTSNSSAVPERLPLVQGQQDQDCGSSVNRAAHRGGEDAARTAMTPQASRTCAAPANPFRAPQQKPERSTGRSGRRVSRPIRKCSFPRKASAP